MTTIDRLPEDYQALRRRLPREAEARLEQELQELEELYQAAPHDARARMIRNATEVVYMLDASALSALTSPAMESAYIDLYEKMREAFRRVWSKPEDSLPRTAEDDSGNVLTPPEEVRLWLIRYAGERVEVSEEGRLRVLRTAGVETPGQRAVRLARGTANNPETAGMSTDEVMELLRGE